MTFDDDDSTWVVDPLAVVGVGTIGVGVGAIGVGVGAMGVVGVGTAGLTIFQPTLSTPIVTFVDLGVARPPPEAVTE